MSDPSVRILSDNLARLSPATQRALQAISGQPAVSMARTAGGQVKAFIKTADGRRVPIHASVDPLSASMKTVQRIIKDRPAVIVVVGLGLGYLLEALDRAGSTAKVLGIEPLPAVTKAMLARRDWSAWLDTGRLTLLVGPDYVGATEAWNVFGRNTAKPPIVMAPLVEREFPEEATRATELARQIIIGVKSNEDARRQFAGRYLLNTLANVPAIATEGNASTLLGAFSRVPCIVIGAGPSLDRNLADLARLEGKALIIAVDTAVRPLLAAGIRPHLIASVDPSELNARHLLGLGDQRGSWLVAEGSVDPAVLTQFERRLFTFKVSQHQPWPWLESITGARGRLRAWGSVLTTAFDLACQMGCDPIVFAGADLAYTEGLQYCRNTVYEPRWQHLTTNLARAEAFKAYLAEHPHLTLPDVHGEGVITTPHFVQFRDWLVSRANEAADRRIVNATGGGILLGGRIGQTDFSVLHLPKSRNDLNLHRRIAAAWSTGATIRARNLEDLDRALLERKDMPLERWLEFGGDTVNAEQIAAAIDAAAARVVQHRTAAVYLSTMRATIDGGSETPAHARQQIHPEYAFAELQAGPQQTHALLDFIERQRRVTIGAGIADQLRTAFDAPRGLRILDVGCGLGRTMAPLIAAGHQVDGVDFSQRMTELAGADANLEGSQLFLSDGVDCGAAPDAAYDLVTSYMCLGGIKSRTIRRQLLAAMSRALRPGGVAVIQLSFHPDRSAATVPPPHVAWSAELTPASALTSRGQVWPTPDELALIYADFAASFRDTRLQTIDFPSETIRFAGGTERISHLIVSGSAAETLAARIYAPLTKADAAVAAGTLTRETGTD